MEESKALARLLLLAFDKGVEISECRSLPALGFIGRCSNLQERRRLGGSPADEGRGAQPPQEFTSSKRLPQSFTPFSDSSPPRQSGALSVSRNAVSYGAGGRHSPRLRCCSPLVGESEQLG